MVLVRQEDSVEQEKFQLKSFSHDKDLAVTCKWTVEWHLFFRLSTNLCDDTHCVFCKNAFLDLTLLTNCIVPN